MSMSSSAAGWPRLCRRSGIGGKFHRLKALLDEVNIEDKGCVERVYRGLCASLSAPGPLSHLERPNYDFARYIAEMIP
jgi:hypothetical protein